MKTKLSTKQLLPLALVSMALVLSACGGSENDPPPVETVDIDPSGLGPNSNGKYADARGFYPDTAGRYPNADGVYPDSNGNYPSTAEAGIFENEHGKARSFSTLGPIDTNPATNPFFKAFGSNQRSCATCHDPADGFTVTPKRLQERFAATDGTDPIFRVVDGSNSPNAPVGTLAERQSAYSMLLDRGVIRISLPAPTTTSLPGAPAPAQFAVDSATDPYGHGTTSTLSVFRRVLPSTNLKFLGSVMWDERETLRIPRDNTPGVVNRCQNPNSTTCFETPFINNLKRQANGATTGHAEFAAGLTADEQQAIVDFEMSLFTAQEFDNSAKFLAAAKAKGGSTALSNVDYYFDINGATDPAGTNKLTTMQVFTAWLTPPSKGSSAVAAARESIARGEVIFNTKTFTMINVGGTNPTTTIGGLPAVENATCTNCHKTPQVGSLSVPVAFDIGISDPAWNLQTDLPVYTLRRTVGTPAQIGAIKETYDPGAALITGRWGDINKFKVPSMRGLATRAPYFHDGSAKTIEDTTNFYIKRFNMVMTAQEIADLNAYLKSL